jgi:hypothetical protein
MRWPWQPKHTFRSALLQLIEGLENGAVVLAPKQELASKNRAEVPKDMVRTFAVFLEKLTDSNHETRRLEVVMLVIAAGIWLSSFGLLLAGSVLLAWPFIILGCIGCLTASWPVGILQRARYHRIRDELFVAILLTTPDEERLWQFLRLYPQFKVDLEKAGVQVNPLLEGAERAAEGWKVTPPKASLST